MLLTPVLVLFKVGIGSFVTVPQYRSSSRLCRAYPASGEKIFLLT